MVRPSPARKIRPLRPVGSLDVADDPDDTPYQSLYRRFRPSTFAEVRGQDHVVLALRNAVRDQRVAHAYLFSGPRGTGKTSTARILAKALNCTDLHDGEPCGVCVSCVEITRGTSLDVHELDAASNNGVDAMRDLVSRAALGTPGRQKVYIVDEVHMLSTAASNALLKTLEEPPAHVVFVLATTDPQKVLPTIRSRTQHFEFRLLGPETLGELLDQVRRDAHLDVPDEALDLAVRRGRGSARDALSVLDQVAASDSVDDDLPELDEVVEALAERDVGSGPGGRGPPDVRRLQPSAADRGPGRLPAAGLPGHGGTRADGRVREPSGPPSPPGPSGWAWPPWSGPWRCSAGRRWTCATPPIHGSISRWRWSGWPIPRPTTRPRRCWPASSASRRRHRTAGATPAAPPAPAAPPRRASWLPRRPVPPAGPEDLPADGRPARRGRRRPARRSGNAGGGPRRRSGAFRRATAGPHGEPAGEGSGTTGDSTAGRTRPAPKHRTQRTPCPRRPVPPPRPFPSRDQLVQAWGDHVIGRLRPKAKALFQAGRFVGVDGERAVFGLPNETHRNRCEEVRGEVEAALSEQFGRPVALELVVDRGRAGPGPVRPPAGCARSHVRPSADRSPGRRRRPRPGRRGGRAPRRARPR